MLRRMAAVLLGLAAVLGGAACQPVSTLDALPQVAPVAQPPLPARLRAHVVKLTSSGERSVDNPASLQAARDYVVSTLTKAGLHPRLAAYSYGEHHVANVVADLNTGGDDSPLLIVGAHYDSIGPGADDNASGVAVLLELASELSRSEIPARVRLVAFVNEEPPCFQEECMGSLVYARELARAGESVSLMISIESVGYWSDEPDSQEYPPPLDLLYPSTGNFLGVVSTLRHAMLVNNFTEAFRAVSTLPVEAAALPSALPGVGWSDHWSFIEAGYPALMLTDTAVFRNPHYHGLSDKPHTLDYERLALVVEGIRDSLYLFVSTP